MHPANLRSDAQGTKQTKQEKTKTRQRTKTPKQKQWIAPQVTKLKTHHLSASGAVRRGCDSELHTKLRALVPKYLSS